MADKPAPPPRKDGTRITEQHGAIPRMGMTIPMPASTRPPAPSSSTSQQGKT